MTVKVLNSYEKCSTLREYMYFVDPVRDYHEKNQFSNLEDAIHQAIEQCIKENVLKDFLTENRTEVTHMMTLDFTFERRLELQREEAIEEGKKEALSGLIRNKMNNNKSLEQIAVDLDVPVDQIRPIYEEIEKELQKQADITGSEVSSRGEY